MRQLIRIFLLTMLVLSSVEASDTIEVSEKPVDSDLQLEPIPLPNLSSLQPAARQKIETLQSSLEVALAGGDLTALEVREGFGFLGQIFHAFELFDAAEICYRNAAALSPNEVRWAYYLGLVSNSKGDLEGALQQYELTLKLGGEELAPLIRSGDVLLELGRAEEARESFQRALDLDSKSVAAEFGLGRVAAARGQCRPLSSGSSLPRIGKPRRGRSTPGPARRPQSEFP
jgi:tetratricopeptide (TPR) repeat protein